MWERAIRVELSPEEMLELKEEHGVEVWEGVFLSAPATVKCNNCNRSFTTEEPT